MPTSGPGPALALALAALAAAGCGLRGGRFTVVEENDVFDLGDSTHTDRDYTQGIEGAFTATDVDTPAWARETAHALPLFSKAAPVHLGAVLGQEIYTPALLWKRVAVPDDRPYAAWLYAGLALQSPVLDADPERRRDRLDDLEVDLGVLGPSARGEQAQNQVHFLLSIPQANGWSNQVGNEPGALVAWETRWRVAAGSAGGNWGWDLLPRARARLGNIRLDATAGAEARFGWNLPRDFGPMPVDSHGLTKGFPSPRPWVALQAGYEARAVAHDAFLQGNSAADSPTVTPERFPTAATGGLSAGWGPLSLSFEQHFLSPEFRERHRHHKYATVMLSWAWFF